MKRGWRESRQDQQVNKKCAALEEGAVTELFDYSNKFRLSVGITETAKSHDYSKKNKEKKT